MYSKRTYISIDLKSFYASVECVERGLDPLTANLVVADVSRTGKTICLAVTPSLKAQGISGRPRLFEVEQKIREIRQRTGKVIEYIAAVPRMALYIKYSANIYSVYLKYFSPDDIHVYSIDEVFIDVTSYLDYYKCDARTLSERVLMDIFRTTGITATVGIAPNLYLAKIAMDIVAKKMPADEHGVRIAQIDELSYRKLLWNHKPLSDFWRIGAGISRRLNSIGAFTMGDVARLSVRNSNVLYKMFGIDAEILIDHAWGYEPCTISDIKKYHSKSNSLSNGQVLMEPYTVEKARIVVREMAEILMFDLFKKNLVTSSVSLFIGYESLKENDRGYVGEVLMDGFGRKIPKPSHGTVNFGIGTNSSETIVEGVVELYDRLVDWNLMVRRFNLCANDVRPKGFEQLSLFSDEKKESKEDKIREVMKNIQCKYGRNALLKGTNLEEGATTIMRNGQIGGHRA